MIYKVDWIPQPSKDTDWQMEYMHNKAKDIIAVWPKNLDPSFIAGLISENP